MSERNVGAIILAAGASSRMGEPKQLLRVEGRTLLRRAVDAALSSSCQKVIVVLGANAERVRAEVSELPVEIIFNERWNEGLGSSVRAGLKAMEASDGNRVLDAAMLMPCDQPHLSGDVLNRLIDARHETDKPIVVSGYEEVWGVPMLFARSLWRELRELRGDRGAQSVARRHASEVECVPFPGGAFDLDTRADYEALNDNFRGLGANRNESQLP